LLLQKKQESTSAALRTIQLGRMAGKGKIKDVLWTDRLIFFWHAIKTVLNQGIKTPVNGEADVLMFPSLESCNPFYKALMLFAHSELQE